MTKKAKATSIIAILVTVTAIVALAVQHSVTHPNIDTETIKAAYQEKSDRLKNAILPAINESDYRIDSINGYAVIMSCANGNFRATTKVGTGETVKMAWGVADNQMKLALENSAYEPKWVKCDIINTTKRTTMASIAKTLYDNNTQAGTFHYGMSIDEKFETAILEQEMNAIRAYNYKDKTVNEQYLWEYIRAARNMTGEETDPTLFQCKAWLCDENNDIIPLQSDGLNYGRRELNPTDPGTINEAIKNAGNYIKNERNGSQFTYLYYPQHDQTEDDYNVVRHAGALWALTQIYETTGDESIQRIIQNGVKYIKKQATFTDKNTAYVETEDDGKFNAGASGLSLVALAEYQKTFDDDRYESLARAIANGIIQTQDQTTGQFVHSLNEDLTIDKKYVIVYYDGETVLGLTKLYNITGESAHLEAAEKGMQYMIDNDYYTYADHWIAYSANELTRIHPDKTEYYNFMFKNLEAVIETYKDRQLSNPTALEALMNSFECYMRAVENKIEIPESFDKSELLNMIYKRADRQMSSFYFPEKAMYTAVPKRVLNTFYSDNTTEQRIRIDDVQHNIGGLYMVTKLHDQLTEQGLPNANAKGSQTP